MQKKYLIIVIILLLFGGLGLAKAQSNQQTATPHKTDISHEMTATSPASGNVVDLSNKETVTVKIKDMKYIPEKIKVTKGTKVTWINEDEMEHNVMKAHDDDEKPHEVSHIDLDPKKFEGPMLKKGESYSFIFNEISENPYHCSPHPWMQGNVEVVQ
jgi:plastocyanin